MPTSETTDNVEFLTLKCNEKKKKRKEKIEGRVSFTLEFKRRLTLDKITFRRLAAFIFLRGSRQRAVYSRLH